ncbi:MAG: hypothetical protein V9E93_15290 [Steroidobacteraceae bacterium]
MTESACRSKSTCTGIPISEFPGRAVHDVAQDAHALFELDDDRRVGRGLQEGRVQRTGDDRVYVNTVPRPLERAHSESKEPHSAHSSRGMCRSVPQCVQRWKRSSPRPHQS